MEGRELMKISTINISKIIMKLSTKEAAWLKALMQNPIGVENPEEEDPTDRKMREIFWNALYSIED